MMGEVAGNGGGGTGFEIGCSLRLSKVVFVGKSDAPVMCGEEEEDEEELDVIGVLLVLLVMHWLVVWLDGDV